MFYNTEYFLYMIPALILTFGAQWYVRSAYNKWSRVRTRANMTGEEGARRLMQYGDLYGVQIEGVRGNMTDHYDPRNRTLRLSEGVYRGTSVAALAIAAHELGHAMQHKQNYAPLRLRSLMVPTVNIGSWLSVILIMVGLFFNLVGLAELGVILFGSVALFSLVTLPVEFNASARAKVMLRDSGLITSPDEARGVNAVLNAAAMTYVAALVTALLQLLYYASLVSGRRR